MKKLADSFIATNRAVAAEHYCSDGSIRYEYVRLRKQS